MENTDRYQRKQISLQEAREHYASIISHKFSVSYEDHKETTLDKSRIARLENDVHYAKLLRLKVISSSTLPKNLMITINTLGCEQSLRSFKDGYTYFGSKKRILGPGGRKGPIVNDFVIPNSDRALADKQRGQHCQIYYDPDVQQYFIRDLGIGFGTFVKIDNALRLKENYLLNMGESFLLVNLLPYPTGELPGKRLRLKLFGAPCPGEVFHFNASEFYENRIRIGRLPKCDVQIDDSLLSKVQATIIYKPDEGWILIDGDLDSKRKSTNGTW